MKLKRQRGLVLVAVMAMLALGVSWYIVSALNAGSANRTTQKQGLNAHKLAEAKTALLGWAARQAAQTTELNPGRLPCAEAAGYIGTGNEGTAAGSCGSGTEIGRLPWRTLGIAKLLDDSGEPLWFAVSDGWKLNTTSPSVPALGINSNTQGLLTVDGVANSAVAVIIAPGKALAMNPTTTQSGLGCSTMTQSRGVSTNYIDYLDCQNVAAGSFRTSISGNDTNEVFNDQVIIITASEVMAAVEGAVADRIKTQVVPQMSSVYSTSDWGATSTNPIFPFAAPFADTSTSAFEGTAGTMQGLMPVTAGSSTVPGVLNAGFVAWSAAATEITKRSGTGVLGSYDCTGTSTLTCTINYGCTTTDFISGGVRYCYTSNMRFEIYVYAANVGMSFRAFNTTYTVSGFNSLSRRAPYSPLQSNGSARLNFRGTWSGTNTCVRNDMSCQSRTFTVPISAFSDHAFLSPTTSDTWYWFFANKWHHVVYYAIAPSHSPSGSTHNCSTVGDCITVSGATTASGNKAILILAGRSLNNAARPNATLSDYLDNDANRDGNTEFAQDAFGKTFNDRFATISNY